MLHTDKIPIRIVSSANLKEHWAKKYAREKKQKETIGLFVKPLLDKISLPVNITLRRIAPRALDDDNLSYSLKAHRDYICSLIIPGLAPGRADGNGVIKIVYEQEKGLPKEYALVIAFEPMENKND